MALSLKSVILGAAIFLLYSGKGISQDWCSLKCKGNEPHTMCKYKEGGPSMCSGSLNGLSEAEKQAIVDRHNELRAKVAKGKERPQPPAKDITELRWSPENSEIAQRWIDQCQVEGLEHDKCRKTRDGRDAGQNLAYMWSSKGFRDRTATIKQMIQNWYDEVRDFDKNLINKWWNSNLGKIGHYTQLVWANTTHVGCGLHSKGGEMKLACNYSPAGNVVGYPVYTVGETASRCTRESKRYPGLCSRQ